jgi:hypothetical protein
MVVFLASLFSGKSEPKFLFLVELFTFGVELKARNHTDHCVGLQ